MYRIDILLKQNKRLFHTRDLALLWNSNNDNTLYTAIKRYAIKKILYPIHKGFYATIPPDQLDPLELGLNSLPGYGYVSCEHVLSQNGVIFQKTDYFTLISDQPRKFTLLGNHYLVRQLHERYLYNDLGISQTINGILIANSERAVADLLYFNPRYHFDNRKSVNWPLVRKIQKEVYQL